MLSHGPPLYDVCLHVFEMIFGVCEIKDPDPQGSIRHTGLVLSFLRV